MVTESPVTIPPAQPKPQRAGGWIQPLDRPWPDIQAEYESGVNPATLSRKYNVKLSTLSNRITRGQWLKPKSDPLRPKLRARLNSLVDRLKEPASGSVKTIREHAECVLTLTKSAAMVEGWGEGMSQQSISIQLAMLNQPVVSQQQKECLIADPTPETQEASTLSRGPGE